MKLDLLRLAREFDQLAREHVALVRAHGRVQLRSSEQLCAQAREIERLNAQAMRLRAAVIVRETELAWAREDRVALEQAIPGLPRRLTLARRVEALLARIREPLARRPQQEDTARPAATAPPDDPDGLEASLRAADLVICQTGCLSHGDYWRVQDHCQRTGKACVLVEPARALRIVRIQEAPEGGGRARFGPAILAPPTGIEPVSSA